MINLLQVWSHSEQDIVSRNFRYNEIYDGPQSRKELYPSGIIPLLDGGKEFVPEHEDQEHTGVVRGTGRR